MGTVRVGRRRDGDGSGPIDPLLPPEPRDARVIVRCTDAEAAAWRLAARQAGLTMSGFVRASMRQVINGER